MDKIKTIVVGVSTYGSVPRVNTFISTLYPNLDAHYKPSIVCCDDGTLSERVLRERRNFCKSWNTILLENGQNQGISYTWNQLAGYKPDGEHWADLVVIFNDDIRFVMPGWLTSMVYFFENNDNIGAVGLPLLNEPNWNDADERWTAQPGCVGSAVGCAFGIRPKDLFSIHNEDGSSGYYNALRSFHEELFLCFKLTQERQLYSWMLPWPPVRHVGGATFRTHEELVWREPCEYLPIEEFLKYVRQSQWYVKDFEMAYGKGQVDRMSYSRVMFAKSWGILDEVEAGRRHQEINGETVDVLDEPQKYVHYKVVDVEARPKQTIKWLDKQAREQEAIL